jgi:hypothetical protein
VRKQFEITTGVDGRHPVRNSAIRADLSGRTIARVGRAPAIDLDRRGAALPAHASPIHIRRLR